MIQDEPNTQGTVYGVHTFIHPESLEVNPDYVGPIDAFVPMPTEVHHWGLVFEVDLAYCEKPGEKKLMVVAMVNGSMCYFGLDEHPDAMCFGPYMAEILDTAMPTPIFVGTATFDPTTNKFTLVDEFLYSYNETEK